MQAKRGALAAAMAVSLAAVALAAPAAQAKPGAGPTTVKCGKFKKKAQKKRCQKNNKANRIAFNQIKNSRFVGVRGDGEEIDAVYCANGKFESRATDSTYGTGVSTGKWWTIKDARVKQGGKWINAFLRGTEGYEIALQRRGKQWLFGVASLGRILEPGEMEKTNAAKDCASLEV
jgi:hypothetical protein